MSFEMILSRAIQTILISGISVNINQKNHGKYISNEV